MSVKHDSRVHTVNITNRDSQVDCFFFSQYIPNNNQISTSSVRVDGQYRSDFILEIEEPDVIYPGHTTHRWVFGEPYPDRCRGIQLRTGQTAEITYMTETPMDSALHSFTGWIPDREEGFFGYN